MTEKEKFSLITIDDHPLFRKGVADLIDMDDELVLVGEAANGQDGLRLAEAMKPDLILLDINMKGMDGIETLRAIKALDLDSRVLMMTVSDNDEDVVNALRLGADGYLLKDMEPEDIIANLHDAVNGKIVISAQLTQLLAIALREDSNEPEPIEEAGLTERELEILALIAKGMSNKVIAAELAISEGTVKVHVKHLLRKLNLRSRVEAAVWALQHNVDA